ncbi:MAG TPA: UDP-glucose 4-epimerase GalE [Firmicutes bacterium]|nr:UDP-glucose 4-epimerase GalE [Bacillota bacterium]
MKVLVAGGAGYIGSHVTLELSRRGHQPVVLDNLVKGHPEAVLAGKFIQGDVGDKALVQKIIHEEKIEAAVHLCAYSLVGESVGEPAKYFHNNIGNGLLFLDALRENGVKKFVFSSSAAVFGEPEQIPIPEDHPKNPTNPYGFSKLTFEGILKAYDQAYGLKYISLRYFNAAGADPEAPIGEDHQPESHLIPIVLQAALGIRSHIEIFGTDYPTPDGTCVRDYIHVNDLAQAHILALEALDKGASSTIYNLGNGQGYSNRQVIETAKAVTGQPITVKEGPRRAGDPAELVASSKRIREDLGWQPQYAQLEKIIETAWRWHKGHPKGYSR